MQNTERPHATSELRDLAIVWLVFCALSPPARSRPNAPRARRVSLAMAFGGVKLYFSGQVQIHRARCTFPVSLSVCWEIGPLQFQGGGRQSKNVRDATDPMLGGV